MSNVFNSKWTYSSNVFNLTSLNVWKEKMVFFGKAIKEQINKPRLDLGLWISATVLEEVSSKENLLEILNLLKVNDLNAFTMNGFPYGNFHQKIVKTNVYLPDWSTLERLTYTLDCAKFLTKLTRYSKVTISTLPLGWSLFWNESKMVQAVQNLFELIEELKKVEDTTGVQIQVCLEPEPGCVLEHTKQTVDFWNQKILSYAKLKGYSNEVVCRYLGVCYDTCHQSVQFENVIESLKLFVENGISIGKIQVSNALEFLPDRNKDTLSQREVFVEEKFLHQTRSLEKTGVVRSYDDLDLALKDKEINWSTPWRTHYHLPLFLEETLDQNMRSSQSIFKTTIQDTLDAVKYALDLKLCEHFEIETYTWSTLPAEWCPTNDFSLAQNISKEWLWMENKVKEFSIMGKI